MRVVTLVPRRADNGERDRLWRFCAEWWTRDHPDWPVFEGHHETGPFNRSAAVNRAAVDAGEWDVAVVIDADIIANPETVRTAVDIAHHTGRMVVPHHDRVLLNKVGTAKVLDGYRGPWRVKQLVQVVYTDSVSCVVAIPRNLWDMVGGFDERFVGWGFEDSAFHLAAETLTGHPIIRLAGETFHLHHNLSPEASKTSPTYRVNLARLERYKHAHMNPDAMRALLADGGLPARRIPRILHRTVPADTSEQVEAWWAKFQELHPGWDCRTYREPIDPADWPLTGDLLARCANGAQKAGLIRAEILYRDGGFYIDSDCEPVRSLEPLLNNQAVAAWEDKNCVPDAVLGAEPNHPAFALILEKARSVIEGGGDAWHSGPGVTTEVLPGRDDVLLLPPGSFYDVHYLEKAKLGAPHPPWSFLRHHWSGSWLTDAQKRSQERRQRR